jgi:septal ring factor EnvC (AmiA/AmiB activator)
MNNFFQFFTGTRKSLDLLIAQSKIINQKLDCIMADNTTQTANQQDIETEIKEVQTDVKNVASLATNQKTQIDSIEAELAAAQAANRPPDLSQQLAELKQIHADMAAIAPPAAVVATGGSTTTTDTGSSGS